jgi:acyl-CoA dehydrogenase
MDPLQEERLCVIVGEELGWGCAGLSAAFLVDLFPVNFSLMAGNMEMAKYCEGRRGCWAITEPDHGTDMLDPFGAAAATHGRYGTPNCVARCEGDKVIINGQKSAWVSGALTAEVCILCTHVEQNGQTGPGTAIIVDMDSPGVSRGKPLEKMGMRALNQGEIFFDNVEVPVSHVIAGPESYKEFVLKTLIKGNTGVAGTSMGVARAAYEEALSYVHERKAGGVPLIKHQLIRYRLFNMFRKVEMAKATLMRAITYNGAAPQPSLVAAMLAKTTCSQLAFEVASEAMQMLGGNGTAKEYMIEKLMRDARSLMIADGCNEYLTLQGGTLLMNTDLL